MDGRTLHEVALRTALALPVVTHSFPFGPEADVCKVVDRVFMICGTHGGERAGEPIVTLKCEPPFGLALREEYPSITPGYHMNKRHWISIGVGPGITVALVEEIVTNAYELVVELMPKSRRPGVPRNA